MYQMAGIMWQLYFTTVFLLFSPVVLETISSTHTDSWTCDVIEKDELAKVKVICRNLDRLDRLQNIPQEVQQLTITDSTFSKDGSFTLPPFPELEHIIFKNSFLNFESNPWPANLTKLSSLTFEACWTKNSTHHLGRMYKLDFRSENFELLPALKTLNFYNNTIEKLQSIHLLKVLEHSYIEGGRVNCYCSSEWYNSWKSGNPHFSKESLCYVISTFDPLHCLTAENIPVQVFMDHNRMTYELCPSKCNCTLTGFQAEKKQDAFVTVDCNYAGLKEMPEKIPPIATRLEFTHNNLQSIDTMFLNPNYKNVRDAFFMNNQIREIKKELFLEYFQGKDAFVLFLENNQLRKLPIEMLEVIMKVDPKKVFWGLRLSGNPWDCSDCTFLRALQRLLNQGNKFREEFNQIRCASNNQRVIVLDVEEECPVRRPLDTIDYLNIAVAFLFIIVLANFLHNVYNYRRYNQLPWIMIWRLPQEQP